MNRHKRRASAKLRPTSNHPGADEFFSVGFKHHVAGQLAEAEACYRQVVAAQPDHADALHLLGVIAYQAGQHGLAIEFYPSGHTA